MNKQRYRIVFNQARGLLMAVAEHVKSKDKASTTAGRTSPLPMPVTAGLTPLRLAVLLATGAAAILPMSAYPAGIAADPTAPAGQQPNIGQTASGIPLVNITTPSAAGVSRNTYSQFNVDRQGAILNNSRTNAQTQLGGWVQGNPNLAAGAARVILNEVNSSNPSLLNGYVEIAGSRAQLVIANPAGISCDGCGFINAHRTTLTTGTPILQGGNLLGYRVGGGTISFLGNGLDARDANYTDVIARAVEVNAGLWANQLNVIAGTNQVDIDGSGNATSIAPIAADAGSTAPAFSVDVAALGGMYAGKIRLVGTEAGLGVRNAGTIGAEAGQVAISADGMLVNSGAIAAGDNMTLALGGDLDNTGDLLANGALTATTDARIINSGKLQAGQNLMLAALDLDNTPTGKIGGLNTHTDISQTLINRGLIDGTDTFATAQTINNIGTGRIYGDHVALAADSLHNTAETVGGVTTTGTIAARDRIDIAVDQLANSDGALIFSAGDIAIGGSLDADHVATGSAGNLLNSSSAIEAMGNLAISANSLVNERSAFSISRVVSTDLPEGLAMLAYNPALQFRWPYDEASPVTWRNFVRDRYIASIASLLGGTLDNAYRNELESLVNRMSESVYRDSYSIWTRLINKINAERPQYIALMAASLSSQSFPLTTYRQYCDDSECDYVRYTKRQRWDYEDIVTSNAAASTLLAGTNANLVIAHLTNRYSSIEAGGDLALIGSTLTNVGAELFHQTDYITHTNVIHWGDRDHGTTVDSSSSSTLIGSVPAIISAGGSLTGSYTDRIDNITIRQNTAPLVNATGTSPAAPSIDPISNSSLYRPASDPSMGFLIETDPRFADYRTWLSSDYMLQQLSFDPALTQQRLGDGFYEQRLVREQVAQLTGRRFLDGYANDEAQYRALMNNALTQMNGLTLVPGVGLSPAQAAQLTSDIVWLVAQDVTLANGTVTQALVPQVYVRPQPGDLKPSGALLAGQEVHLEVTGDPANSTGTLMTSGMVAGRQLVELDAANIQTVRGLVSGEEVKLAATQDINIEGGTVAAERALIAKAGHDLTVKSSTSNQHVKLQGTPTYVNSRVIDRVAGLYVSNDNAILVASAGHDVNLMAAAIQNSGAATDGNGGTTILARHDLNIGTVTETMQSYAKGMNSWRKEKTTTSIGSAIGAKGDVTLLANNDLTARAANVASEIGAITATAGGNIAISTGTNTFESDAYRKIKKSSGFGSSKKEFWDSIDETTHTGSTFSGDTVALKAGANGPGNVAIQGSNVVSTNGTTIEASGNVNITSVADVHDETHKFKKKSSGFGTSGASISYGTSKLKVNQQSHAVTQQKSMVGSVAGDVTIKAGETYTQTGSDVVAPQGDIDISAKAVNIEASRNTYTKNTETRFKQSGITLAISNPVVSAIQTASQMKQSASETSDPRMKTLAAATTALAASNAYDAVQAAQAAKTTGNSIKDAANQAGGINFTISIGSSKSSSKSSQTATIAQASQVIAGGNVNIQARGAGENSDINIVGSQVRAGNDATLIADDAIDLMAARNTTSFNSKNKSSSASIGVSLGTISGLAATASASKGKGKASSNDVTWMETKVQAGNKVTLESGTNTNLIGAQVRSEQVVANVGTSGDGNLNIQSLQDISTYDSKQRSAGVSVSVPIGASTYGGSISSSNTKMKSNYASVNEQAGIFAGDDGFQVNVSGNTNLTGAVVASTEEAIQDNSNSLTTKTLTVSNIQNEAEYEAKGSSATIGGGLQAGLPQLSGAGVGSDSERADSVTVSAISQGMVNVTDNDAQQELNGRDANATVALLNRDVQVNEQGEAVDSQGNNTAHTIAPIFDQDKVQKEIEAQMMITQAFSQEAPRALATFAISKTQPYQDAKDYELIKARQEKNILLTDYELAKLADLEMAGMTLEQARATLDDPQAKSDYENWNDNGNYRRAANIIVAAIGGSTSGLTSAVTKESLAWAADQMRQAMIADSVEFPGICIAGTKDCLSNMSGDSVGVNGDNIKVAGGRVVLETWCEKGGQGACERDPTTRSGWKQNEDGTVVFRPTDTNGNSLTMDQFINLHPELRSELGGVQGGQGQMKLLGIQFEYASGSFWDKLAESYAGTHDQLNSIIWYDKLGNGKNLDETLIGYIGSLTNSTNVLVSTPFALSVLLPPEVWNTVFSAIRK